jgi:peptide-methionine (S)-S-oxide reductase
MTIELATFGAGCFWGVELKFRQIPGVRDALVGYEGGETQNPTYRDVCTDETGHAEVVQVEFDSDVVSFERLLDVFFGLHDPTTLNRQGPDFGSQYRSAIFYHDEAQKTAAVSKIEELNAANVFLRPIVTQVVPAATFYKAEDYHQRYLEKRGQGSCSIH